MGDINSMPKHPLMYLQVISSVYQLEQLIKEPNRVTNSSATTIDLIFTNMVDNIATSGDNHLGISDHSLIYLVQKFVVLKTRPTIKEVPNFKHIVKAILLMTLVGSCGKMLNVFVADGDSQEFQQVSRPVSWDKDYLTGS